MARACRTAGSSGGQRSLSVSRAQPRIGQGQPGKWRFGRPEHHVFQRLARTLCVVVPQQQQAALKKLFRRRLRLRKQRQQRQLRNYRHASLPTTPLPSRTW
jgi:hypothetical protein